MNEADEDKKNLEDEQKRLKVEQDRYRKQRIAIMEWDASQDIDGLPKDILHMG